MSLLDNYEELWNAQDIRVFKEELDKTLKPILIGLEERWYEIHYRLNDLDGKIQALQGEVHEHMWRIKEHDAALNRVSADVYEAFNTKLQDICNDIETIKLNLKN